MCVPSRQQQVQNQLQRRAQPQKSQDIPDEDNPRDTVSGCQNRVSTALTHVNDKFWQSLEERSREEGSAGSAGDPVGRGSEADGRGAMDLECISVFYNVDGGAGGPNAECWACGRAPKLEVPPPGSQQQPPSPVVQQAVPRQPRADECWACGRASKPKVPPAVPPPVSVQHLQQLFHKTSLETAQGESPTQPNRKTLGSQVQAAYARLLSAATAAAASPNPSSDCVARPDLVTAHDMPERRVTSSWLAEATRAAQSFQGPAGPASPAQPLRYLSSRAAQTDASVSGRVAVGQLVRSVAPGGGIKLTNRRTQTEVPVDAPPEVSSSVSSSSSSDGAERRSKSRQLGRRAQLRDTSRILEGLMLPIRPHAYGMSHLKEKDVRGYPQGYPQGYLQGYLQTARSRLHAWDQDDQPHRGRRRAARKEEADPEAPRRRRRIRDVDQIPLDIKHRVYGDLTRAAGSRRGCGPDEYGSDHSGSSDSLKQSKKRNEPPRHHDHQWPRKHHGDHHQRVSLSSSAKSRDHHSRSVEFSGRSVEATSRREAEELDSRRVTEPCTFFEDRRHSRTRESGGHSSSSRSSRWARRLNEVEDLRLSDNTGHRRRKSDRFSPGKSSPRVSRLGEEEDQRPKEAYRRDRSSDHSSSSRSSRAVSRLGEEEDQRPKEDYRRDRSSDHSSSSRSSRAVSRLGEDDDLRPKEDHWRTRSSGRSGSSRSSRGVSNLEAIERLNYSEGSRYRASSSRPVQVASSWEEDEDPSRRHRHRQHRTLRRELTPIPEASDDRPNGDADYPGEPSCSSGRRRSRWR